MHTKLTIPERLKDLRVSEKRMSLQDLSDATDIPSSTLGNYEKDENIDMSLGNLITLANFYNVSTDYLLGLDDKKYLLISGLNEEQIAHIQQLVDDIAENNQKKFWTK